MASAFRSSRGPRARTAAVLCCLGVVGASLALHGGGLLREVFLEIPGSALTDLLNAPTYPNQPDATNLVQTFECPENYADDYGQRVRGYVVPPTTGEYVFWIASDDNSVLYLSIDDTPARKVEMASVPGWTSPREWTQYTSQESAPVTLQAGQLYYVEALMKEGGGDDHLAVRWRLPDGSLEEPIPEPRLIPWGVTIVAPNITRQPASQTVQEGRPATFSVEVSNLTPVRYQWERGGVAIAGATGPTFTMATVGLNDGGAVFRCRLSNSQGEVTSSAAVLTVTADLEAPRILMAQTVASNLLAVLYSERVDPTSATNRIHYLFSPEVPVQSVRFGDDTQVVIIETDGFTNGARYTLTVNQVRDTAVAGNLIAPNTQIDFVAAELAPGTVGVLTPPAAVTPVTGGADVEAAGTGVGLNSDQFHFSYQLRTGDFDLRVRVQALALVDLGSMAALMARDSLATNSPFAATVATPSLNGISFLTRVASNPPALTGSFPVNYPYTWLRLQRTGDRFTGHAGFDGETWQQVGSATNALRRTLLVGLAVASRVPTTPVRVEFREFSATPTGTEIVPPPALEPPGPSSRRTGLALTEIMYRPAPRTDSLDLEFVELFNSLPRPEDISGYQLSGAIDYTFPPQTVLPAGGYVVIAHQPDDVRNTYALPAVFGAYTNNLPGGGGTVQLRNRLGAVLLEVTYGDAAPWPVEADGGGHSLVLARPSYGEGNPAAWGASYRRGGSPGHGDGRGPEPWGGVLVNEFLAHTDDPQRDYVELYNHGTRPVDLSGLYLSDDPANAGFRIPDGTLLPPRGFAVFTQDDLGFALSSSGERLLLVTPDQSRVLQAVRFGAQANGVTTGRYPDGAPGFHPLHAQTPGAPNAGLRIEEVVLNELMYHPISGDPDDEYIELFNRSSQTVNLGHWRFVDGVDFVFPPDTLLSPGGYLVVARNAARILTNHPTLSPAQVVGDFQGELSNRGERVALARPSDPQQPLLDFVVVDEVTYREGGHWGRWSDGGGSSLELVDPRSDNRQAANWADSDETAKAPWTPIEYAGGLDLGLDTFGVDRLFVLLMGEGECLVDEVYVTDANGADLLSNPGFEAGGSGWDATGTHGRSTLEISEGYRGQQSFHVRANGRGSTDANNVRAELIHPLTPGPNEFATLRAQVRWLRGSPEILLRVRGNYLEAAARMTVPRNLGTPGARNSRWRENVGPAIWDVQHHPVLPALGEAVRVTARAHDPDGVTQVRLRHHLDGSEVATWVELRDDGTAGDAVAGDGHWTGMLPAQATTNLLAFSLQARDGAATPQVTQYPADAPARECLVRWGESDLPGNLATYRIWMTKSTLDDWANRHPSDNGPLGVTFVYGSCRALYDASALYSGSPFHWTGYDSPLGRNCNYVVQFSPDNRFLGATDFVLNLPSNLGSDRTFLREQLFFWLSDQMNRPSLNRRFMHLFLNGVRRGPVFEDAQQPNREVMDQWYPPEEVGELFKIEDWFEYDDSYFGFVNVDATLEDFKGADGAKKLARYRWTWRKRAVQDSAHDYDRLFLLADVLNASDPVTYVQQTRAWVDVEQWMRCMALRHLVGDWDAYGYRRGKNMYAFKPQADRWQLFDWDISFAFGLGDGPTADVFDTRHFDGEPDHVTDRMYQQPEFRRAYLRAIADAVDGPFTRQAMSGWLAANYAALKANGLNPQNPESILGWVDRRRTNLLAVLATNAAAFQLTAGNDAVLAGSNLLTVSGTAPVSATRLTFNGVPYPVTWTNVTSWTAQVPLQPGLNRISIVGWNGGGQPIPGGSVSLTASYTGAEVTPENALVLSEIQYHPAGANSGFVEIHNKSGQAFDLSGYRLQGVDFVFAPGTVIHPGAYLVVASDRFGFAATYGLQVPLAGVFAGRLQNNGETLRLLRPGATADAELVVDEVRYSDVAPWPTLADGDGPSLQLIDADADNRRPANWQAVAGIPGIDPRWQFASVTGTAGGSAFYLYLASSGDVYLDDFELVDETTGGQGPNLMKNPGFENPLAGTWTVSELDRGTQLTTRNFHSGRSSLHVVSAAGGHILDPSLAQTVQGLVDGHTYTLRFWYLPSPSGGGLTVGFLGTSFEHSLSLVHVTLPPAPSTPGSPNSVATVIAPFPPLWINELRPTGVPETHDAAGEPDPWVELYNAGTTAVDLVDLFLTDDLNNATRWPFPTGAALPPGGFRVVWLDGQPEQSSASEWHANFRAAPVTGRVSLVQRAGTTLRVLDDLPYDQVPVPLLIGSFPDGDPIARQVLHLATPGAPNSIEVPPLRIFVNEWMAANDSTIADPADGQFDDWFELYNPNAEAVDLSGYWLSDSPFQPFNWRVPTGTIVPALGFLLVWADNQTGQNLPGYGLHAGFKLSADGEAIALSAPDGRIVDVAQFGLQLADQSQGRWPDGGNIGFIFQLPTPGAPNVEFGPRLTDLTLSGQDVALTWTTEPGKVYQVQYKERLDASAWAPLAPNLLATADSLTLVDLGALGTAARFYRVVQLP